MIHPYQPRWTNDVRFGNDERRSVGKPTFNRDIVFAAEDVGVLDDTAHAGTRVAKIPSEFRPPMLVRTGGLNLKFDG